MALTLNDLWALADRRVLHRGEESFKDGAVRRLRVHGDAVEAEVWGSEHYRTRLDLTPPFASACTCPYEGVCKHVVALGLAYLHRQRTPDRGEAPSLYDRLQQIDPQSLLELAIAVADEVPEATAYMERWLLREGLQETALHPVDTGQRLAELRSYVEEQLDPDRLAELDAESRRDWTDEGQEAQEDLDEIGRDLRDLVHEVAGQHLPDEDDEFVIAALRTICRALAEAEEESPDVADCWSVAADAAAARLAERLAGADEPTRLAAREDLMPLFHQGARFLEPVLLAGTDDPAAARRLVGYLRGLPEGTPDLTALKALLQAGLPDEAEAWLRERIPANQEGLILLARHLRAAGQPVRAMIHARTAAGRMGWLHRDALREWMLAADAAGETEEALTASRDLFQKTMELDDWRACMQRADATGRRAETANEALDWLRADRVRAHPLCTVLADESAHDPACLEEAAQIARALKSSLLMAQTARNGLQFDPDDPARQRIASDLLRDAAEALALQGGDYAYDEAARTWTELRTLMPSSEWTTELQAYQARHRRRRNLCAALTRAGLTEPSGGRV